MSSLHPQQLRNVRLLLAPLGVLFLFIGTWFAVNNLSSMRQHQDASNWKTVDGLIVRSTRTDAKVADAQSCPKPVIEYKYNVNGRQFRSRRISFSKMVSCDLEYTREILRNYSVNKSVPVYYNPSAPEQAVLQRIGLSGVYWGFALGLVFAFIGGALVYVLLFKEADKHNRRVIFHEQCETQNSFNQKAARNTRHTCQAGRTLHDAEGMTNES